MKYTKTWALEEARARGRCEWCRGCFPRLQAAHLFARGRDGASTLNVPLNLAGLCGPCHHHSHRGDHPTGIDLIAVVAARECLLQPDAERQLRLMLRAPKGCQPCPLCWGCGTVKLRLLSRPQVFRRHACVCGTGILDRFGEPWHEQPRRPTWA